MPSTIRPLVISASLLSWFATFASLALLFSGTSTNTSNTFLKQLFLIRYDYSAFNTDGTISTPKSWATIYIRNVCTGSPNTKITCINTLAGTLNEDGSSMSPENKETILGLTGPTLLISLAIQTGAVGISSLAKLWMFKGMKRWNRYIELILAMGTLAGIVASIAGLSFSLGQSHISWPEKEAPITYSSSFVGLLAGGALATLFAFACVHVEANYERFTLKGAPISKLNKPHGVRTWQWKPCWKREADKYVDYGNESGYGGVEEYA